MKTTVESKQQKQTEKKEKKAEEKRQYAKPSVVRIRRVVAAGGHKV